MPTELPVLPEKDLVLFARGEAARQLLVTDQDKLAFSIMVSCEW